LREEGEQAECGEGKERFSRCERNTRIVADGEDPKASPEGRRDQARGHIDARRQGRQIRPIVAYQTLGLTAHPNGAGGVDDNIAK
jgi:hypothetical protein